jgi:hypothetical protein
MSVRFLKAALPPSRCRTGTMQWPLCLARSEAVSIPPADDTAPTAPRRSRRFAWPSGGTEEFLGRWFARTDSWDTEAKGVLADPLYVFGAAGRTGTPGVVPPDRDGNRKDRTSRCRQEGRLLVTRGITVPNRSSSSREFRGARLDFSVHIWVRPLCRCAARSLQGAGRGTTPSLYYRRRPVADLDLPLVAGPLWSPRWFE